jgi:hypothetical protein
MVRVDDFREGGFEDNFSAPPEEDAVKVVFAAVRGPVSTQLQSAAPASGSLALRIRIRLHHFITNINSSRLSSSLRLFPKCRELPRLVKAILYAEWKHRYLSAFLMSHVNGAGHVMCNCASAELCRHEGMELIDGNTNPGPRP